MQHSQIANTGSRTRQAWVERFWVSEDEKDLYLLGEVIDSILKFPPTEDALQPSCLDVAEILRHLDSDQSTLLAALLADNRFNALLTLAEVEKHYGSTTRQLLESVRQLQAFRDCIDGVDPTPHERAEHLRQMIRAVIGNPRAVLIKLAWNLQVLRLLSRQEISEMHRCVARLTMESYAPWANRLGVSQIKWEMEDLAFRFLQPDTYKAIAKSLSDKRIEREQYIADFTDTLRDLLKEHSIKAEVYGRPKHIYSIWKKKHRKQVEISELYDLRAVRVMVDDINTCYNVLGLVHDRWVHIPDEYDDYIANRKPNGYQSIHTVVLGPQGKYVEIQIRTREMHRFAELGIAAHWRYKEGGKYNQAIERAINSSRRMLESGESDTDLLEDFRTENLEARIFVVTPKGQMFDLPEGATPIDFAYHVHTSVGHRCRGAKVNGSIVPLNSPLFNGAQVEIITGKEERPRQDWLVKELGYIKSGSTRQKIRQWFSQQNHEQNCKDGERLLEKERHLLNLNKLDYAALAKHFNRNSEREFLIAVGKNDISTTQVRQLLVRSHEPELKFRKSKAAESGAGDVEVRGVKKLFTQMAKCCHPVNGDPIVGYLSQGRGVIVHRADCAELINLRKEREERIIDVTWGSHATAYIADVRISTFNKSGVLGEVASLLAKEKVNIQSLHTRDTNDPCFAIMDIALEIKDVDQLGDILEKLLQLSSVLDVQRKGAGN